MHTWLFDEFDTEPTYSPDIGAQVGVLACLQRRTTSEAVLTLNSSMFLRLKDGRCAF